MGCAREGMNTGTAEKDSIDLTAAYRMPLCQGVDE